MTTRSTRPYTATRSLACSAAMATPATMRHVSGRAKRNLCICCLLRLDGAREEMLAANARRRLSYRAHGDVGTIADDRVDAPTEQPSHVELVIHRPDLHREPGVVRIFHEARAHDAPPPGH